MIFGCRVEDVLTPEEVTLFNVDSSSALQKFSVDSLLGELQFSFIEFLIGQSLEGLQQWKSLVDMVLRSDNLMCNSATDGDHALMFVRVLHVINSQLRIIPKDFFVDELSKDNFLKKSLRSMCQSLKYEGGLGIDSAVFTKMDEAKKFALEHFLWDYDIEEVCSSFCY
jgi:A1 cistron-splicing factor AAR2